MCLYTGVQYDVIYGLETHLDGVHNDLKTLCSKAPPLPKAVTVQMPANTWRAPLTTGATPASTMLPFNIQNGLTRAETAACKHANEKMSHISTGLTALVMCPYAARPNSSLKHTSVCSVGDSLWAHTRSKYLNHHSSRFNGERWRNSHRINVFQRLDEEQR